MDINLTFYYSPDEIASFWRSIGYNCEKRKVMLPDSGNREREANILQIQTAPNTWIDAEPAFGEILQKKARERLIDDVTKFDVLDFLKRK